MTNEEIIYREAIAHNIMTREAADAALQSGLEIPLHTYAAWKSRGYQVRKGEKAAVKTSLWKRSKGKKKARDAEQDHQQDSAENPEASGHFFLAAAFLFTAAQVEEIAAR